VQQSLPFVIRGGALNWPACSKWTFAPPRAFQTLCPLDFCCRPAFFASQYARHQVEVTHAGGAKHCWALGDYISSWSSESSAGGFFHTLAQLIPTQCPNPDYPYLRGWSFDRELPELVEDIRIPCWARDFFDKLPAASRPPFHWIFMGPGSTSTPLHVDPLLTHAWLAQVRRPSHHNNCLLLRSASHCADPWTQVLHHFPASRPPFSCGSQRVLHCFSMIIALHAFEIFACSASALASHSSPTTAASLICARPTRHGSLTCPKSVPGL